MSEEKKEPQDTKIEPEYSSVYMGPKILSVDYYSIATKARFVRTNSGIPSTPSWCYHNFGTSADNE